MALVIDMRNKFATKILVNEIIHEITEILKGDGGDAVLFASTVPNIDMPLGVAFGLTDRQTGFFVSLRNHKLNNVEEQETRLRNYFEKIGSNDVYRKSA